MTTNTQIEQLTVVLVEYKGPTNTLGSRIQLSTRDWAKRKTVRKTIPYDYEHSVSVLGAVAWFERHELPPSAEAALSGEQALLLFPFCYHARVLELLTARS
jgi:hypothetical protein